MGTKIIRSIKKSKKSADYFIIQPMPTGRGSQHFPYEKTHSFHLFNYSTFHYKDFGGGRKFDTNTLIYI